MNYIVNPGYYKPKSLDECYERYGPVSTKADGQMVWRDSHKWLSSFPVPEEIKLFNRDLPIVRIICNSDIHKPLEAAFSNILWSGVQAELRTFDGCFNPRWVRGRPGVLSIHSFALALDLNASQNPLNGKSSWSPTFVRCFTDVGWSWGGNFTRCDPMHFEWKGGV